MILQRMVNKRRARRDPSTKRREICTYEAVLWLFVSLVPPA